MRNRLLVLIVVSLVLSGCSHSTLVDIRGEDRHVTFPEAELEMRLGNEREQTPPKRDYVTLSAGYTRGAGHFNQPLASDEYVRIGDTDINGPQTLHHQAWLDTAHISVVLHSYLDEQLEVYGGLGLGYMDLHLTTSTVDQGDQFNDSGLNLHTLLGASYHLTPILGAEANTGWYLLPFFFIDTAVLYDTRIQLFIEPSASLRLFAGYREWSYHYQNGASLFPHSDIHFIFSGPTAGLVWRF